MSARISPGRFRLVCREVAGKVAARRDRVAPSKEAVLRELLRRIESQVGRRPADITRYAGDGGRGVNGEIDRLFDANSGVTWASIAEEELLARVFPTDAPGEAPRPAGKSARS